MRAQHVAAVASLLVLVACGGMSDPSQSTAERASTSAELQLPAAASPIAQGHVNAIPVCPGPMAAGDARCHSLVVVDGTPAVGTGPRGGYAPADLYSAYGLGTLATGSTWSWNGRTIAIVDAYGYPSAESDLAVYRSQFQLPPCTTANGCFRKIDQRGGTRYPRANCGWAQETALDIQMASAICPSCKILLVQADSNSFLNLGIAVNQAATQGATVISNSYGGSEFSSELDYAGYYDHPGVAVTVSSGDGGYGVEVPAAFKTVVAVGGTSLKGSAGSWAEAAWSGAGSGCSSYVGKPSWQKDSGCARRTVADVSAVADPSTGVSVYDSYKCQGVSGWLVFGGTSVSSPIIAGVYALVGGSLPSYPAADLYSHTSSLNDVTSGSNGTCGGSYLCTAGTGYDGPTGLGTPNGTGAF